MKNILKLFIFFIVISIFLITSITEVLAEDHDEYSITNHCIGYVCIGDTIESVKEHYPECVIKKNDSDTGYYVFDNQGNFLIEFSTKKDLDKTNEPIRYIMTSNPNFSFTPGNIQIESKVSELIEKYGEPKYDSGPNGYFISFEDWPIKEESDYNNFSVNVIVGIYNPKLSELFKFSGTINEEAELNLLYSYPESTILNTIEIFSDHYKNGEPIQ